VLGANAWAASASAVDAPSTSYPGIIELDIDARDTHHRIIGVHETLPVAGGDFVLLYPKWIPGDHAPTGPIDRLAGLVLRADGTRVDWYRDAVDAFAFHVELPQGTHELEVDFQFLAPIGDSHDDAVMTRDLVAVKWLYLVLYPAGYSTGDIRVHAQARLPTDFRWATSLKPDAESAAERPSFAPVPLSTLGDSPLYAGAFVRQAELNGAEREQVRLTLLADRPERAAITPEQLAWHRALVRETHALFGYWPFAHYDFLVTLSAPFGINGLEHRGSSEVFLDPDSLTEWQSTWDSRYLVAHELVHAWNGKWRVPDGLVAADFNTDLRTDLLWVYEGQTQYWAKVLTARSGLWTAQQARDDLAVIAAHYSQYPAAQWRALRDSMHDPVVNIHGSNEWRSWQRSEDYYDEGVLLWLDADTLLRAQGHGAHSLDEFAAAFFAGGAQTLPLKPYRRADLVDSLRQLDPLDWEGFFAQRIDRVGRWDPLEGIRRGGYELVFDDQPGPTCTAEDARRGLHCFSSSIGLTVATDGLIESVDWEGVAFRAGLAPGMKLIAVDGATFSPERLLAAIVAARQSTQPIAVTAQDIDRIEDYALPYHDGPRYPHLARQGSGPASLDAILRPRAVQTGRREP